MALSAKKTVDTLVDSGLGPFIGVPCSALKPLINRTISTPGLEYIPAVNEGEAVAIAVGMQLAGKRPVVMFQNSGLGNTVNALSSLNDVFDIPVLLIVTWRGAPELNDAPQHRVMGEITFDLLSALEIRHSIFPEQEEDVEPAVRSALEHMQSTNRPYAFVLKKGTVAPCDMTRSITAPPYGEGRRVPGAQVCNPVYQRLEMIRTVVETAAEDMPIVSTTGKTSRELFNVRDRALNFYMVGSMGSASSLALGLSLAGVGKVVVLDGDGAFLMRMEAVASIGRHRPPGFIHIVLDNKGYESTGSQPSISPSIDFGGVALSCGYATSCEVSTLDELRREYARCEAELGPHFIRVLISAGSDPGLGRPTVTPPEVAVRFRKAITQVTDGR